MNKFITFLLFFAAQTVTAQIAKTPIKLEEKTTVFTENSSKYGSQKRKRSDVFILYSDGSKEMATPKNLKPIVANIPMAQYELKKWQKSSRTQLASFPLLAVGFVGAVLFTKSETRQEGILIGSIGLASGIWTISHFEFQKRKHHNRLIELCNKHLSEREPQEEADKKEKDVIRLGLKSSGNTLGIGLNWTF